MIITDIDLLRRENEDAGLEEIPYIIQRLEYELENSDIAGIGLAAPQIGINKKVAIIRNYDDSEIINLVNPKIINKIDEFTFEYDSCLSLPGVVNKTKRFKQIVLIDYYRPSGLVLSGLASIVAQHEIDHLEGILIIDRVVGKNAVGRNDLCPCGKLINGKRLKFKNCHGK